MVALARIRHDAQGLHAIVSRQLLEARHHRTTRRLLESLAEECTALVLHLMHRGVPEHLDLLAEACADLLEHGTAERLMSRQRARAKQVLRQACRAMRATGTDGAPISQILELARISRRVPRVQSCTPAHLEVLAAPITRLLLELFGS
jgi:hypothetical protein